MVTGGKQKQKKKKILLVHVCVYMRAYSIHCMCVCMCIGSSVCAPLTFYLCGLSKSNLPCCY